MNHVGAESDSLVQHDGPCNVVPRCTNAVAYRVDGFRLAQNGRTPQVRCEHPGCLPRVDPWSSSASV